MTKKDILKAIKELGENWTVDDYKGPYAQGLEACKVRAYCPGCGTVKWMLFIMRDNLSGSKIKERMISELRNND